MAKTRSMAHWEYRPFKHLLDGSYSIVEFYEFEDGHDAHTGPCRPGGDTKEELISDLEMMLKDARERPVLLEEE
jgi:hypothetical protein